MGTSQVEEVLVFECLCTFGAYVKGKTEHSSSSNSVISELLGICFSSDHFRSIGFLPRSEGVEELQITR